MRIDFYYSPLLEKISLVIDGTTFQNKHTKLYDYLRRPIEEWLDTNRESYRSWNGFFTELTEEINEDEFEFVFHGNEEDYRLMEQAFEEQAHMLRERGYEPEKIKLICKINRENTQLKQQLLKIAKVNMKACQEQEYMIRMKIICRDIEQADPENFNAFRDIYDRLTAIFLFAKNKSIDKPFWDELLADLKIVFEKAV